MKNLSLAILSITLFRVIILFFSPLELSFDEAQYWHWSNDLSFGYFSKPPMIAYFIFITTSICGNGEACIRLASPLAHAITSFLIYLAGKNLFDKKIGYFAALTYLTLTGVSFGVNFISTDAPLLMFYALSLYFLIKALNFNQTKDWLLMGLAIGLGLLSKYSMAIFPLMVLVYLVLNNKHNYFNYYRNFALAIFVAFLVYAPNFLWNYQNHFASYAHTKANTNLSQGFSLNPLKSLEFLGGQFLVFGLILFACLIIFITKPKENAKLLADNNVKINRFWLLFLLSVPLIAAMLVLGLISRANANWAAPSYLAATILVTSLLIYKNKLKLLKISFILNLTLMFIFSFLLIFNIFEGKHKLSGWQNAGLEISQIASNNPDKFLLFDERKILTPFLYYLEPKQFDRIFKWNLKKEINDHYDLTTNLENHIGKDFIYISRWDNAEELKYFFDKITAQKIIEVKHNSNKKTTLYITILQNFKGYDYEKVSFSDFTACNCHHNNIPRC